MKWLVKETTVWIQEESSFMTRKEENRRETSERRRTQSTFKVFFTIISLALESVGIRFYDCVIRDRERQLTGWMKWNSHAFFDRRNTTC